MSFFDTTPSGRILNRFSKDIYTIDELIPRSLNFFISTSFTVISTIFVISFATPLFMVVILPLAIIYFLVQVGKKHESITLYSFVVAILCGHFTSAKTTGVH